MFLKVGSKYWYDDEFKTVVLKALNNGEEMTEAQLAAVTNEQFNKISFDGNTKITSIKDLETGSLH